jgi:hypothetical protein
MKKKILFVAPDYYGFNEVVFDGLKNHSDFECVELVINQPYIYKNFGEKIINAFSKIIFNKNLKKEWVKKQNIEIIDKHISFDVVIINRPDVLKNEELDLILKKSKRKILLLWDSLDKINLKDYVELFDDVFSFDSDDCKKYNLKKITNFYWVESENIKTLNYDIAYMGTNDKRMDLIVELYKFFSENSMKAKAKIFTYKSHPIQITLPKNIEIINKIIPFKDSYKYYLNSKCILDVAHENQIGLSFRPFEALGLNKKLITTNKEIIKYDFYNPKNIYVVDDLKNIKIPTDFFESNYQKIPQEIYEKYSLKNWVKTLLNNE